MKGFKCPRGTRLQAFIFRKEDFEFEALLGWLDHYEYPLAMSRIEETTNTFRYEIEPSSNFYEKGWRVIPMGRGKSKVKGVVGCPRTDRPKKKRPANKRKTKKKRRAR